MTGLEENNLIGAKTCLLTQRYGLARMHLFLPKPLRCFVCWKEERKAVTKYYFSSAFILVFTSFYLLASVGLPKHSHCKEVVERWHLGGKKVYFGNVLNQKPQGLLLSGSPLLSPPQLTFCPGFSPCLATKGNSRAIFSYNCFSSFSRLTAKREEITNLYYYCYRRPRFSSMVHKCFSNLGDAGKHAQNEQESVDIWICWSLLVQDWAKNIFPYFVILPPGSGG